jgi:hypothetical protein
MPCNEFCGLGHHAMWARVVAVPMPPLQGQYVAYIERQLAWWRRTRQPRLLARGPRCKIATKPQKILTMLRSWQKVYLPNPLWHITCALGRWWDDGMLYRLCLLITLLAGAAHDPTRFEHDPRHGLRGAGRATPRDFDPIDKYKDVVAVIVKLTNRIFVMLIAIGHRSWLSKIGLSRTEARSRMASRSL